MTVRQFTALDAPSGEVRSIELPEATAAKPGVMAAADYVRIWGALAPSVSVAAGAGYVNILTTDALLVVKNTLVRVGFEVEHNRSLVAHLNGSGDCAFAVSWLDNDTQELASLATGIYQVAAAPVLTGGFVSGVGWRVTFNADKTVTLSVAKDAVVARRFTPRWWRGTVVPQTEP